MATQRQIYLYLFFVIFSLHKIDAYVFCNNTYRGCDDGFTCSENGVFCHKNNDTSVKTRSSWSVLQPKCSSGSDCTPNAYCLDYKKGKSGPKCVTKTISSCDAYLSAIQTSGCQNSPILTESYEICSDYYLYNFNYVSYPHHSVIHCADLCQRIRISSTIRYETLICSELERKFMQNYAECYLQCQACDVPSTWPILLENVKKLGNFEKEVGREFAAGCANKFMEKQEKWTVKEIKKQAKDLIEIVSWHSKVDTSDVFGKVMDLQDPSTFSTHKYLTIPPNSNIDSSTPFHQQKFHFWYLFGISATLLSFIFLLACLLMKSKKTAKKLQKSTQNVYEQPIAFNRPNLPPPRIPDPRRSSLGTITENEYESETSFNMPDDHEGFDLPMPSSIRRS